MWRTPVREDGVYCGGTGAKQLTMDIYDRIIQMCENRRCVYKPLLPPSLHENLTWLILVSYSSSQIH